jgi:pantoate kinase
MHTSDVLGDPDIKERVKRVGEECYEDLSRHPTVDDFFRLSREFTMRSGIVTPRVKEALVALDGLGDASMIMHGNSVFARGDLDAIEAALAPFGPTFRLSLDNLGPRVLAAKR